MLQRDKGFFLAELLLSLAALIMAISILLPYSVFVISQIIQLRQEEEAFQLLYNELHQIKALGTTTGRSFIHVNGVQYKINAVTDDNQSYREVCIQFEGEHKKNHKICAAVE